MANICFFSLFLHPLAHKRSTLLSIPEPFISTLKNVLNDEPQGALRIERVLNIVCKMM